MQRKNRLITITLIASIAIGWVALWMEWNPRYNTGEALQKIFNSTNKTPETSVSDYQKSQKDIQKSQIESQKKEIYAWYEMQKKQIQSDAEAAKKALTDQRSTLSETEKAAIKESLYAQYKQIQSDAEAKMKELQSQKETKMKALEWQYLWVQSTDTKPSTEAYAWIEAKKKEIYTWFETQKKQIRSDAEAAKKALTDQLSTLSETEKAAKKESLYAQYKQIQSDAEAKIKDLQSQMEAKMNALKSEYLATKWNTTNDQSTRNQKDKQPTSDKEKMRQEMKDKLWKVWSTDESTSACKTTFSAIRTTREADAKIRKAAWDAFTTANKWAEKEIFAEDSRQDVKDTLDAMRLQIRLVERKYTKALMGTSSTVTTNYVLTSIDSIANKARIDLADYVQDWQSDAFNTYRDWFLSVLKSNKTSLLTLMTTDAQTINWLADTCKKKAKTMMPPQDQSDRKVQWQLNSSVSWGSENQPKQWDGTKPPQKEYPQTPKDQPSSTQ